MIVRSRTSVCAVTVRDSPSRSRATDSMGQTRFDERERTVRETPPQARRPPAVSTINSVAGPPVATTCCVSDIRVAEPAPADNAMGPRRARCRRTTHGTVPSTSQRGSESFRAHTMSASPRGWMVSSRRSVPRSVSPWSITLASSAAGQTARAFRPPSVGHGLVTENSAQDETGHYRATRKSAEKVL